MNAENASAASHRPQTAVREATRRAVVENLNHLDEARLVLVRR